MMPLNEIQTACQTAMSVGGFTVLWFQEEVHNMLFYIHHCENKCDCFVHKCTKKKAMSDAPRRVGKTLIGMKVINKCWHLIK